MNIKYIIYITIKKINNKNIKVILVSKVSTNQIVGYNIFLILYANIFICAMKRFSKTNIIFKIIESCTN